MPSEGAASPTPRWAWLRSQGLGLACGQATVLLLGVGTVVIARTRDGASARVQLDDLTVFFREPSGVHLWLYALFPVTALYALNTALCTWDAARARLRRGAAPASSWAPTVIHLAFLVALLAHGVGGFWNHDEATVTVAGSPVALDGERTLRLTGLTTETTSSGKVKQVHAAVELAGPGGATEVVDVGYNRPLSRGLGSELLLLAQAGPLPGAVALTWEERRCLLEPPGGCQLGPVRVEVTRVLGDGGRGVTAVLQAWVEGQPPELFPLRVGGARALGGGTLRFEGLVEGEPAVVLRHRLAPGHPIALASALLLLVGLALMGRRWRSAAG
jgi:hypothetical protein